MRRKNICRETVRRKKGATLKKHSSLAKLIGQVNVKIPL